MPPSIIAQRQFRVEITTTAGSGVDIGISGGLWDVLSGAGFSTAMSEVHPAGETDVVTLVGPTTPKPITVSRSYAPDRDDPIITKIRQNPTVGLDVTRSALNRTGDVITGSGTKWIGCIIVDMNDPATDSSSGEAARWEIQLKPTKQISF